LLYATDAHMQTAYPRMPCLSCRNIKKGAVCVLVLHRLHTHCSVRYPAHGKERIHGKGLIVTRGRGCREHVKHGTWKPFELGAMRLRRPDTSGTVGGGTDRTNGSNRRAERER